MGDGPGRDAPEPLHLSGIIGFTRRPTPREWRRAGLTFALGVVALFLLVLLVHPQPQLLPLGTEAPPIVLDSSDGQRLNALAAAAHHNLVVAFFDTQCGTCRRQGPELCSLAGNYGDDLFVGVDAAGESASALAAYARGYLHEPCPVRLLVDPGLRVSRAYRAAVVPTVYVVDSHGKLAYAAVGAAGVDELDAELRRLEG